ncbi:hypothetical protein B1757_09865 [Acidithiobacillus marinus]|uniref:Uncharacterized protein n=1 Tax=Acidithiobacillus marinus TaxID=187490 RepID=A0A2I1DKJ2_9PROT|nr:hypothetical protein B1757_09865 [Acidithiobacillus marinus]
MKSLEAQYIAFLKLPIFTRVALPVLTISAMILQGMVFFWYNTSLMEFLIMFVLYYFSWRRILDTDVSNQSKFITATYLFSSLVICLAFCVFFIDF